MKNFKFILALASVFALGGILFASTASKAYLSSLEGVVVGAESSAKEGNAKSLASIKAQKLALDATRKTITLSTLERFSDWRLNKRYESAVGKLEKTQSQSKSELGKAAGELGKAAGELGGALKGTVEKAAEGATKTGKETADKVKEGVKEKATQVEEDAKKKAGDAVQGTSETITGKIKEGAGKLTDALNGWLNKSDKKED